MTASQAESDYSEDLDNQYEQIKKCRTVFHMFERGTGSILTKDLGSALRALGQIPSDQEIEMIAAKLEQDEIYDKGYTKISFDDFYRIVQENSERRDDIREMVVDSFKALDPEGTGLVEATQLTKLLTGMGEALTPADVKEFLQEAGVNKDGKIEYCKFVEQLLHFDVASADTQSSATTTQKQEKSKGK